MPDWSKAMSQTFEYYIVDPGTWKDKQIVSNVISSSISRDSSVETLGSANIKIGDLLGECYIRIYLVTNQNGIKEKHPLGTFLIQTPSYNFDGKIKSIAIDAYTPLLELKENLPPLGYSILEGSNILNSAYTIVRDHMRAPVVKNTSNETLFRDFVANVDDTWITFIYDLLANANHTLELDELGRVLFSPQKSTASLQPVWTFDDGNSSILYSDLTVEQDLYGIPNVVEVIYSNGRKYYQARAVNNDPNSPVSVINRGREITRRISNPDLIGNPSERQIDEYAKRVLKELSTLEYTISYKHGYCPVRIGDCVRLNYTRAGLQNVKAKVISQTIDCVPGCPVTEKAVFTNNLWGGVV